MKIVHISTYDNGGAGLAAYRLHRGLLSAGIDSRMLVSQKTINDNTIFMVPPDVHKQYQPPRNTILRKYKKMMRRRGYFLTDVEKVDRELLELRTSHPSVFYTSPISQYDVSEHTIIREADIIHLHWIQNFVNYKTFFSAIDKPIVWTHHDLNPLYGGFHYSIPYKQYYNDYKPIEDYFFAIKKDAINHASDLTIVAISEQMHNQIAHHGLYKDRVIYNIPNSVNTHRFLLHDRYTVRRILNISPESKVFFFSSLSLNDKRKGLDTLINALNILNIDNAILLCLGDGEIPTNSKINIRHFSPVSDTEWLSILYSAADYFVAPSLEESFLQTAIESLCCGTPVIMTPVGIAKELITEDNGIICSGFTPESIANGIAKGLQHNYDRDSMRNDVIRRFDVNVVVKKYIRMYKEILSNSKAL